MATLAFIELTKISENDIIVSPQLIYKGIEIFKKS